MGHDEFTYSCSQSMEHAPKMGQGYSLGPSLLDPSLKTAMPALKLIGCYECPPDSTSSEAHWEYDVLHSQALTPESLA